MTDDLRQDGIVPDDDVTARFRVNPSLELVVDGFGTVHFARPDESTPRERIAALSPEGAADLVAFLSDHATE